MSDAENKAISQQFYDVFNHGDVNSEQVRAWFAPGYVSHTPSFGDVDVNAVLAYFTGLRAQYPDGQFTVDEMLTAEGGRVVARLTFRATDPASGQPLVTRSIGIFRYADGLAVEAWSAG